VLHPNQGEIICGDQNGFVSVYDLAENKFRTQWKPEGKSIPIRSVAVASDASMIVAATNRGHCYVFQPFDRLDKFAKNPNNKDKEEKKDDGAESLVKNMQQVHADDEKGQNVVTNFGNTKADKQGLFALTHKIPAHDTYCLKALLSPDTRYLATCSSDTTIKIFSVDENFKMYKHLKGHQKWVWDISFSADSAFLVSASSDKTAKLWEIKQGSSIVEYTRGINRALTCVALNDSSAQAP
jgi:G protein beta subunit-like protein